MDLQYQQIGKWRLNGPLKTRDGKNQQHVWVRFGIVGDIEGCEREVSICVNLTTDSISEGMKEIDAAVNNFIAERGVVKVIETPETPEETENIETPEAPESE